MNITIKATNCTLTENSRELIERKFGLLERFVRDDQSAQLALEVEEMTVAEKDGSRYRVEANLMTKGALYRAEARSGTLETAAEKVRHELEGEVTRAHGRARRLFRRGGAVVKNVLRGWR